MPKNGVRFISGIQHKIMVTTLMYLNSYRK